MGVVLNELLLLDELALLVEDRLTIGFLLVFKVTHGILCEVEAGRAVVRLGGVDFRFIDPKIQLESAGTKRRKP